MSGSTNHSSACWPPPGFVDGGGLDQVSVDQRRTLTLFFWGNVNGQHNRRSSGPDFFQPPSTAEVCSRYTSIRLISPVLTCHMHPVSYIRSVPHCKSPPIAPPACSDRWMTGRRHIAAPVLPVKQGDFDWPEGPQHQCSILTNPSPHACPSQAVIVRNSRISHSILM